MFDHLGDALTVLRILQRLSQAEVADRAGIKATQVSRYETNQVQPQLRQLTRLMDALDVNLPGLVLALYYVRQLRAVLELDTPPARMVCHTVEAWWSGVTEEHLAVAQEVSKVVGARFRLEVTEDD